MRRLLLVIAVTACTRTAVPTSIADAGTDAIAVADADADAGADADAVADAGPPRPVIFHSLRWHPAKLDRVGPRTPSPDGEPDAVLDLVVEGDFKALVLYSEAASLTATTTRVELAPPRPSNAPLTVPKLQKPPPFAMTKHAPVLFAFEGDALLPYDGSDLARVDREGRRTLRLHTWAAPGMRSVRVLAERRDGTWVEGPSTR